MAFRSATRRFWRCTVVAAAIACLTSSAGAQSGPAAAVPRHVFVLQSYDPRDAFSVDSQSGLDEAFRDSGLRIETFVESLDANRIPPSPARVGPFADLLRAKYASIRFDVLVATDNDAMDFLRARRDELFPGVPLVFFGISKYTPAILEGRTDLTGIGSGRDFGASLAAIERLQPDVRHVVAICDDTTTGRAERAALEEVRGTAWGRLDVRFLSLGEMTLDELGDKLAPLGSATAVLLLHASVDRQGVASGVEVTTPLLSRRSAVPLYVISDVRLGLGALGGSVTSGHTSGLAAGRLVVEILEGTAVGSIPVEKVRPARYVFDYQVMKRFGLSPANLPAGSNVINRPPSILDQYRTQVVAAAVAFVIATGFLVALSFEVLRRRRVEATLRTRQATLTGILNSVPQGIFWKDRDSVYLGCNEVFARAVSRPDADSVRGLTDADLSRSPEVERMYRDDDREVMESNRPKRHIVESFLDPDGTERWVDTTKVPLADEDGQVYGVLGVWDDISDLKRTEQERARLIDQLRQAAKMEAVGRLAGGMAHDFNNVLTAITGNLELARDELHSPTATAGYLDDVQAAAERAAALIRQLLAFSRKQMIAPRVVNLNDIVTKLQSMLARLIGEDIVLEARLDPALASVRLDPGQFEQVLVNLSVNARDAMPHGGRLTIETTNVVLDDEYCTNHPGASPGPQVLIAVTDTGSGMPPEVLERIFEPFFTTKPLGRGTGLGLATAFGSVKQVGGHIEVDSRVGAGTTFQVYLPRVDGAPDLPAPRAVEAMPARGGETVLLVEDDDAVRALTASMLNRLGYTVLQAPSGPEALKIATPPETRIDLLLTDVVMPGMNGRELAEQVVAIRPNLRVLFSSGYTENVIVHHGLVDDRLAFIPKPFTVQSLAAKLREVLSFRPPDRS
jgi:two-component system, cell cycle sensor histidine kinase and response regulator CckA